VGGIDKGGTEGGRALWLRAGVDWHNQTWQKEVGQPLKAPPQRLCLKSGN